LSLLINDELVHDEAFHAQFRHLGGFAIDPRHPAAQHELQTLRHLAEQRVIGFVLLRQHAEAAGITVSPAELEARREAQWGTSSASVCAAGVMKTLGEQMLVERYCLWITRHEPRPSRTEVETFYRQHREQFLIPEQVRVQQVVRNIDLPEEEAAGHKAMHRAEQELNAGTPFHQVAERYSDCGGTIDLGWMARGEMVPAFESEVFALSKSQRTGIFRTVFGLHLATVLERKPAGYRTFDEIRTHLAKQMLEQRRQHRIETEIAAATRVARIAIAPTGEATVS
jgi:hypothetical protein